jgi:hypothetical protein
LIRAESAGGGGAEPAAERGLTLLTRIDCALCDEFVADWQALAVAATLPPLQIRDVDASPLWQRRFGLKVPVLLWDGEPVLWGRVDRAEIERLFRQRNSL